VTGLADFLLARIAEDEAATRPWSRGALDPDASNLEKRFGHDRVLAECEAKRQVIEDALNNVRDARARPIWTIPDVEVGDELDRKYRSGYENARAELLPEALDRTDRLLRLLALPYVDHADWREEFRP
jgi:hypothetical protein